MTTPTQWRFEVGNAPTRLRSASDELESILASHGVSVAAQSAARLVCEEVVLNALEHGGARLVTLEIDPARAPYVLFFEDDGVPFDPNALSVPLEADTRADVSPRGRGLILVRRFARSIEHRFAAGRNRLKVLLVK